MPAGPPSNCSPRTRPLWWTGSRPAPGSSGPVRLALHVGDSAATAARLVAGGARRVADPVVTPWGHRNARVQAPDGMQLTLFELPDD